jgi:hypothetical protein
MLAGGTQECCNKRKIERGIIVMLHQQLSCGNKKKHPFRHCQRTQGGGDGELCAQKRKNAYSSYVHTATGLSHKCSIFTEDREGDEGMET